MKTPVSSNAAPGDDPMSDVWEIRQGTQGWAVYRNGSWYSDVDDQQDGVGLVRSRRASPLCTRGNRGTVYA